MGVAALGRAILEGQRTIAPGTRPADFASPQPIACVERATLGAVLFLVWDKRHEFYRSLCELYDKGPDGAWWDESQSGVAWPWTRLERPPSLGVDRVEFSNLIARGNEGPPRRLVYALPGVAGTDVDEIRCEHADSFAACPIEPTTGAFICLGELAEDKRSATIKVTTADGVHDITEALPDLWATDDLDDVSVEGAWAEVEYDFERIGEEGQEPAEHS
jgi:hypothetical protein